MASGECVQLNNGKWVWEPDSKCGLCFEDDLRTLANRLRDMNKPACATNNVGEFEVGDRVWGCHHGWGTVSHLKNQYKYPVTVMFDSDTNAIYTSSGRYYANDCLPTLFHDEVKPWPNPLKPVKIPDVPVDTPLWVRWGVGGAWTARHLQKFEIVDGKVKAHCFDDGKTSHTGGTPTSLWNEWSLVNPNA